MRDQNATAATQLHEESLNITTENGRVSVQDTYAAGKEVKGVPVRKSKTFRNSGNLS